MNLNSAITERDKKLIYGLLIVVILFVFGWCIIRPLHKKIVQTSERIEEASAIKSSNEAKVIGLSSAAAITEKFEADLADSTDIYYDMMDSSEIDRLVTTYILGKGLIARSLNIQMPSAPVNEAFYRYSDNTLGSSGANTVTEYEDITLDTADVPAADTASDDKESNTYFNDAVLGFLTGYNTEQITMIGSPVEEYSTAMAYANDTASSGIYCVTLAITVEGDEETEQKVIDELSHNPSLRIVSFNWIPLDPITYIQEDGTVLVYQSENMVLSLSVNLYMTDKSLGQEE